MAALPSPSAAGIRHPRLTAFRRLLEVLDRCPATAEPAWTDFLTRLPLFLGETPAERVVPYSFSDDVLQTLDRGVDGLLDLIQRRADPAYERERHAALLPDERLRVVLWPKRFCPRTIPEQSGLRGVIRLTLLSTPELDSGLLESWLVRPAGGRPLIEMLERALGRSIHISRQNPAASGIAALGFFALQQTLVGTKERLKTLQVKGIGYTRLERAVGMALSACFIVAVQETLGSLPAPGPDTPEELDYLVVQSALGPVPFLSIRGEDLADDINPFGYPQAIDDALQPLYLSELESNRDPQRLLRALLASAGGQSSFQPLILRAAACEQFRRLALDHLIEDEDPATEVDRFLAAAYPQNEAVLALIESPARAERLAAELQERLEKRRAPGKTFTSTEALLLYLRRVQQAGPPWENPHEGWPAVQDLLERFLLRQLDEFASAHLEIARGRVVDRRRHSPTAALIQEYEAGRLYRFADDEQPLLKARLSVDEAQLFVDLKGYTRRTARAKELVMAEFLKTEFYEPILQASKKYFTGVSLVPGEQNIQLVNLLGDAVAFSGNIVSLVGLAHDIQRIFRDYRSKLQRLTSGEEGALAGVQKKAELFRKELAAQSESKRRELDPLEKELARRRALEGAALVQQLRHDFQAQFEVLKGHYREQQAAIKQATDPARRAEAGAELAKLKEAHNQLKARRQQTLKRLKGASGEALASQLGELLCRPLQEKVQAIEEQLRLLAQESLAFEEAIEQELHLQEGAGLDAGLFISFGRRAEVISIDDDVWGKQRVAISERINESARGTARNPVVKRQLDSLLAAERARRNNARMEYPFRVCILATSPSTHEPASDIYNLGEAMSERALDAYLSQTRGTHFFFRVEARLSALPQEIQERFFIPDNTLPLIVGSRTDAPREPMEVFRFAGEVLFRGFEVSRPTPVYEILRPDSAFLRLLLQHHLDDWLVEARAHPECRITSLSQGNFL